VHFAHVWENCESLPYVLQRTVTPWACTGAKPSRVYPVGSSACVVHGIEPILDAPRRPSVASPALSEEPPMPASTKEPLHAAPHTLRSKRSPGIRKALTGISGLDELTSGGLPRGRPTLVCGGAGCGKTVLGLEFLVRGATEYGEPGVIFTFEEMGDELAANVASFGFDLPGLIAQKKLVVDHVQIDGHQLEEAGDYDLDGLFIRLESAIDAIGAKRVLLDTLEVLFAGLSNKEVLRSELRRLFRWLKDKGVTAVITGERGESTLTRHGLEEYVSDCVILLDLRVQDQISTRRLRVVKYRGARHGTDEYPFLIGDHGISVLPLSSLQLVHQASTERISCGNSELDQMLGGGYYRGSSILISGGSGSGKTSVAACLASTSTRNGRALYFSFEESPAQLIRNMGSIGVNLAALVEKKVLRIISTRPSGFGLETHLFTIYQTIEEFKPSIVVLDPITDFAVIGNKNEIRAMMTRLVDHLKTKGITALLTSAQHGSVVSDGNNSDADAGISSLIDTWIALQSFEVAGERNRAISVRKSRGTAHSNQVREFVISSRGLRLINAYRDSAGFVTGSAREAQQRHDDASGGGANNNGSSRSARRVISP
jgi:circadian clock protein KaiC